MVVQLIAAYVNYFLSKFTQNKKRPERRLVYLPLRKEVINVKWTPNNIITLIAILGTLTSPIASIIFKWFEEKNDKEIKKQEQQLKIEQSIYEDLKIKYRDVFENYIKQTQKELNNNGFAGFSSQQKELQSLVYIYANDNVIKSIQALNRNAHNGRISKCSKNVLEICRAFNSQWQTLQPKQN